MAKDFAALEKDLADAVEAYRAKQTDGNRKKVREASEAVADARSTERSQREKKTARPNGAVAKPGTVSGGTNVNKEA